MQFRSYQAEIAELDKRWTEIHQRLIAHLESVQEPIDVIHTTCECNLFRVFIHHGKLFYQEEAWSEPKPWGVLSREEIEDFSPKTKPELWIEPKSPGKDVCVVAGMILAGLLIEEPQ